MRDFESRWDYRYINGHEPKSEWRKFSSELLTQKELVKRYQCFHKHAPFYEAICIGELIFYHFEKQGREEQEIVEFRRCRK